MRDFRRLTVWEKSHELALEIYKITERFPRDEIYGLTSQLRRASVSIPTNIAEGCGMESSAAYLRYLHISMGSASELEYLLLLVNELRYIQEEEYRFLNQNLSEVRRMLNTYTQKIKASI